jgi:hypothetical protein
VTRPREVPRYGFAGTVHPGDRARDVERVAELDLDRLPDPEGAVRVLLTPDDCVRLLEIGYEVHLQRSWPVQPLDSRLTTDDDADRAWLEERVMGIERAEGQ